MKLNIKEHLKGLIPVSRGQRIRKGRRPEWLLGIALFLLLVFTFARIMWNNYMIPSVDQKEDILLAEPHLLYGLPVDSFHVEENSVRNNENLSDILLDRGVSPQTIDKIAHLPSTTFDVRKMKAGKDYALFYSKDSLRAPRYFAYSDNPVDYYVINLSPDSCRIHAGKNEVNTRKSLATGVINSSLWNAMKESNLDPMMAIQLSELFAWSIDFFAIQKGDHFTVLYDQDFVKGEQIGVGHIHAAIFNASGQDFYAIHFEQEDGQSYFDEQGRSIRKEFLKAPLKLYRISSRFSAARLHPILRIVRPHFGVDYAAPTGTPVFSIGDGVVQTKTYQAGGGGNFVKIRHNSVYTTTYMHLSKFGPGIQAGTRVRQGQVIGFVGATGLASGPHLDFRVFMNGSPVDPLKIKSPPANPVSEQNKAQFEATRDRLLREMKSMKAALAKKKTD
ncbi:MAG: peptidoglycan DD-metalloendopeptidase family protein [Marinilabiliales bacterium]|nr:peptidoglycan DD-metalloendopeptidase family protein [Marinilabiliales bacterium]